MHLPQPGKRHEVRGVRGSAAECEGVARTEAQQQAFSSRSGGLTFRDTIPERRSGGCCRSAVRADWLFRRVSQESEKVKICVLTFLLDCLSWLSYVSVRFRALFSPTKQSHVRCPILAQVSRHLVPRVPPHFLRFARSASTRGVISWILSFTGDAARDAGSRCARVSAHLPLPRAASFVSQ